MMGAVVTTSATQDMFTVRGEVKQPGAYPWTNGVTLLQAIATSGGYSATAPQYVRVLAGTIDIPHPTNADNRTTFRFRSSDPFVWVKMEDVCKDTALDPAIRPGCVISVNEPIEKRPR